MPAFTVKYVIVGKAVYLADIMATNRFFGLSLPSVKNNPSLSSCSISYTYGLAGNKM